MRRRMTDRTRRLAAVAGGVALLAPVLLIVSAPASRAGRGEGGTAAGAAKSACDYQAPGASDATEFGTGPMAALARLARAGDLAALDRALDELKGRVPLVEADGRNPGRSVVTFLYRGDDTVRTVTLPQLRYGPVPFADDRVAQGAGARAAVTTFRRVAASPLWYLRLNLPNTALLGYTIGCERVKRGQGSTPEVEGEEFLDPLNPQESGGRGSVSLLRLRDAPSQQWIVARPGVPTGRVEDGVVESQALGEKRHVAVYLPPGYDASAVKAHLVFVFDGDWFRHDLRATTVLDNLLFERRIPPTVAVFVDTDSPGRERDLVNNPRFADFMAKELRPWVAARYRISQDPRATALSGASFGGLGAAFIALRHPDVFGNVLSQSGAFWPPAGWAPGTPNWSVLEGDSEIIEEYVRANRQPIRFYMDCGLYEPSMLMSNRRLRDVLRSKGYPVVYVEHPGSHSGVYWRNSIGDGLIALFGTSPASGN